VVRLDGRVAKLLEAFLECPGVYLSVNTLLDRVWAPVVVSPSSVYQAINVLRRALATGEAVGVAIEMSRRRGYRLVVEGGTPSELDVPPPAATHAEAAVYSSGIAVDEASISDSPLLDSSLPADGRREVRPVHRVRTLVYALMAVAAVVALGWMLEQHRERIMAPAAAEGLPTVKAPSPPSVAVLAFDVPGSRTRGSGQMDGAVLAQDLVARLTRRSTLGAVAYSPRKAGEGLDQEIRRVGATLGVRFLLDGHLQENAGTVAVDLTLVDVVRQSTVWSKRLEVPTDDLFELVRLMDVEVASKLLSVTAKGLAATEDATEHIPRPQAYRDYLTGLSARNESTMLGWKSAVQFFRRATVADPQYAAPLSALVLAETDIYDQTGDKSWLDAAERDSAAAVRVAPTDSEAYGSRGYLRQWYHLDWVGAGADFQHALQLGARSSRTYGYYGSWLAIGGRLAEARAYLLKAVAIDPLAADQWLDLALYDMAMGDYRAAEAELDSVREVNEGSAYLLHERAELYILRGEYQRALETASHIEFDPLRLRNQALAENGLGLRLLATQHLNELIRRFPDRDAYQVAQVYGWWGDFDNAFRWLHRCVTVRDPGLGFLPYDPLMSKLRPDPRYRSILKAVGLPTPP
jgi:TolB-like protein/DNA-binding winged helix-turn-helix (wHTH) protein/Tfp pilus assembly protein PilF